MGRRAYSRTLREGLPPRGWVKGTPGISSEAKEFALGGGYGGWLGRGVSRGEDAGPALPRGICEAQQRTEVKVARLCAESGLELPEGRLADPPLLLLLLPLLLLGFQLCLKLAGRGQGLDLRGTAERDPQSESGEEELGHGAPSKQNSSPARDTETWSAARQGAGAKTPSRWSSQVRFLFSRTFPKFAFCSRGHHHFICCRVTRVPDPWGRSSRFASFSGYSLACPPPASPCYL